MEIFVARYSTNLSKSSCKVVIKIVLPQDVLMHDRLLSKTWVNRGLKCAVSMQVNLVVEYLHFRKVAYAVRRKVLCNFDFR